MARQQDDHRDGSCDGLRGLTSKHAYLHPETFVLTKDAKLVPATSADPLSLYDQQHDDREDNDTG
jgi:hypothetical protein